MGTIARMTCFLRRSISVAACVAACVVAGCAAGGEDDAGQADAASPDAGPTDAGPLDAGPLDAGPLDAFVPDDGGPSDAGEEDSGATVTAPVVDGEPRADHRRPSWVYSVPAGAVGFRVRIDGGAFVDLDVATTVYTAPVDLSDGLHTFGVRARDEEGRYGPEGTFDTTVSPIEREGDLFWRADRVMATSPLGHVAAISAHNAYEDGLASAGANLAETVRILHAAQTAGADLLELDLVDVGGVPRVEHDDTGNPARAALADVLDDALLRAGNQVLFLEIKETTPTEAFVRALLDLLAARRGDYARAGRPVVLRAFHSIRANLDLARTLLDTDEYVLLRPYVRLSVLFSRGAATRALVRDAVTNGYDMVELEYRSADLLTSVSLARSLGLGVNVYTIPATFGEVFVANLRESVDAITVDYPIALSRAVVTDDNAQVFVDVSQQTDATVGAVPYLRTGFPADGLAVNGGGEPLLRIGAESDPLFGARLVFEPAATRSAALYDADALPGEGVFVAVHVRFGTLTLVDGDTMSVLAKTNAGGYGLELFNPTGTAPTVLRFGVYVGGAYRYATIPASALTTTRAHFITCAYDGDGGVRMWVDNDDGAVAIVSATGGITNNDLPVILGADPQAGASRYFFDGELQMALVQSWGAH